MSSLGSVCQSCTAPLQELAGSTVEVLHLFTCYCQALILTDLGKIGTRRSKHVSDVCSDKALTRVSSDTFSSEPSKPSECSEHGCTGRCRCGRCGRIGPGQMTSDKGFGEGVLARFPLELLLHFVEILPGKMLGQPSLDAMPCVATLLLRNRHGDKICMD